MANQESRLAIVIDTTRAEQSVRRLRELLRSISADGGRASTDLGRLGDRSTDTSARIDRLNRSSAELNTTLGRLKGVMASVFAGIGVSSIIKTADTMQNLDSQVKLVTNSMEQFKAVQGELRNIASRQYADIEAVTQLYTRSQRALSSLGKSQNDVLQFTENLSMAMLVGGASAQEQSAALLQLSQALGSGILAGDEFRSIAEQAPILLSLVSKEMGVTRGELKKLASDGKITSEVIYNALASATEELTEQVALMPITVGQALTALSSKYKTFIGDLLNNTTGLTGLIAQGIGFVSENFNTLATIIMGGLTVWGYYALAASSFVTTTIPALILGIKTTISSILAQSAAIQVTIASTFSLAAMQDLLAAATYRLQQARVVASLTLLNYKLLLLETIAVMQAKVASVAGAIAVQAQYALSLLTSGNLLTIFSLSVQGAAANLVAKASATVAAARAGAIYAASLISTNGVIGAASLGVRALTSMIIAKTGAMITAIRQTSAYSLAIAGMGVAARAATGIVGTLAATMARLGAVILAHPIMAIAATIFAVTASTRGMKAAMEDVTDAIKILGYMFADTVNLIIYGVKDAWAAVSGWFNKMTGGGTAVTNMLGKVFGKWFEGTRGGFVGLIQVAARVFDSLIKVALTAVLTLIKGFQNLYVVVRNVATGIANGFISAFNTVKSAASSTLNWLAGKFNSILDMWDSITGTQSKKIRTDFEFQPTQKIGYADFVDMSWGNSANQVAGMMDNFSLAGWVDSVIATNDAAKSLQDASAAGMDVASAYTAMGDAAEKGSEKAKKGAKGTKKELTDAEKAAKRLGETYDKTIQGLGRTLALIGNETKFGEWVYDLHDKMHELFGLPKELKDNVLSLAASIDLGELRYDAHIDNADLQHQVDLLSAQSDLEREILEIKNETLKSLAKFEIFNKDGTRQVYDEAKAILENAQAQKIRFAQLSAETELNKELAQSTNDIYKQMEMIGQGGETALKSFLYDLNMTDKYARANVEVLREYEQALRSLESFELAEKMREDVGGLTTELLNYGSNTTDRGKNDYELEDALTRLRQARELGLKIGGQYDQLEQAAKQRHADKLAEIENAMYQNRAGLFASASKALLGENSRTYKLMFAIEKGYALQSAWLKSKKAVLDAYAETPGSVWNKAWAAAKAAADTGLMAAAIAAVQAPIGQAHDGIMSVPKSGTWNLEKGERVLPAHTAKAMDKKLEQSGSGEVNITINVDAQGNSTMDAQNANQISKQLANTIKAVVVDTLHKERRQGGILYG